MNSLNVPCIIKNCSLPFVLQKHIIYNNRCNCYLTNPLNTVIWFMYGKKLEDK